MVNESWPGAAPATIPKRMNRLHFRNRWAGNTPTRFSITTSNGEFERDTEDQETMAVTNDS